LKLRFEQAQSGLFEERATVEHAFAQTKTRLPEINAIKAVSVGAPKEYICILI